MRKINFVHEVCHSRAVNRCRDLLLAENSPTPSIGLISEVQAYCSEIGMSDMSQVSLWKEDIKETMKDHYFKVMWLETLRSSKVQCNWNPDQTATRGYSMLTKLRSQLVFSLKIGELNLSVNRPNEAKHLYGGLQCHVKVCGGLDEMPHIPLSDQYLQLYIEGATGNNIESISGDSNISRSKNLFISAVMKIKRKHCSAARVLGDTGPSSSSTYPRIWPITLQESDSDIDSSK